MENENLMTKLILRLISNLIPSSKDKKQTEHYLSYSLRLLNSRLNPTTNNESTILQILSDKGFIFNKIYVISN